MSNRNKFDDNLLQSGQQMVEEILDAQRPGCPPEYFNIDIPAGHPQYDNESVGGEFLPLLRSAYDARTGLSPNVPRQQVRVALLLPAENGNAFSQ